MDDVSICWVITIAAAVAVVAIVRSGFARRCGIVVLVVVGGGGGAMVHCGRSDGGIPRQWLYGLIPRTMIDIDNEVSQ